MSSFRLVTSTHQTQMWNQGHSTNSISGQKQREGRWMWFEIVSRVRSGLMKGGLACGQCQWHCHPLVDTVTAAQNTKLPVIGRVHWLLNNRHLIFIFLFVFDRKLKFIVNVKSFVFAVLKASCLNFFEYVVFVMRTFCVCIPTFAWSKVAVLVQGSSSAPIKGVDRKQYMSPPLRPVPED